MMRIQCILGRHPGHSNEIGRSQVQTAIDKLETEVMDPNLEDHFKELLRQRKKDEDNVKRSSLMKS